MRPESLPCRLRTRLRLRGADNIRNRHVGERAQRVQEVHLEQLAHRRVQSRDVAPQNAAAEGTHGLTLSVSESGSSALCPQLGRAHWLSDAWAGTPQAADMPRTVPRH